MKILNSHVARKANYISNVNIHTYIHENERVFFSPRTDRIIGDDIIGFEELSVFDIRTPYHKIDIHGFVAEGTVRKNRPAKRREDHKGSVGRGRGGSGGVGEANI